MYANVISEIGWPNTINVSKFAIFLVNLQKNVNTYYYYLFILLLLLLLLLLLSS